MPGATATHYTARLLAPDLLERGRSNVLRCPIYASGALVEPSEGSLSIYDQANVAQVNAAAITINSGSATYTYTPSVTLPLGEGWRVEWTLTIAGAVHVFRNDAALVRACLYPVVSDVDLYRRHAALDPARKNPISTVSTWQDKIDEAWAEITLKLIAKGDRPNLVMSPSAFREVHIYKTLELVFLDLATRLNAAYQATSDSYATKFDSAWKVMTFLYDKNDEGQTTNPKKRRSGGATTWLCGRGEG